MVEESASGTGGYVITYSEAYYYGRLRWALGQWRSSTRGYPTWRRRYYVVTGPPLANERRDDGAR